MVDSSQVLQASIGKTVDRASVSPITMSATNLPSSPLTPQSALLAGGGNHTVNNTSPNLSMNTAPAHSVYPAAAHSDAPNNTNASGSFATTAQDGGLQQQSLPPMGSPESTMTTSSYYGAPPQRAYASQPSMYQSHYYQHQYQQQQQQQSPPPPPPPAQQQQYQQPAPYHSQYFDGTSHPAAQGLPHRDSYPTVAYQQHGEPAPYQTSVYGNARNNSVASWASSGGTDDADTPNINPITGQKHTVKDEPLLTPETGLEEVPKQGGSYAALIGEALLLAPPPHQMYVREICKSIKERYPYYRQYPLKLANGVRHQTSMAKAFVKLERPWGDQGGGARKWAIRDGCQTWFKDGEYKPPPNPPGTQSTGGRRGKGGKRRRTATNAKDLILGTGGNKYIIDPPPPSSDAGGPSEGKPWDPIKNPLPWSIRPQSNRQLVAGQHPSQHTEDAQLIPRAAPLQPMQSGSVHAGFAPPQYAQQPYGSTPQAAYSHHYASAYAYGNSGGNGNVGYGNGTNGGGWGGGGGGGGGYAQPAGQYSYPYSSTAAEYDAGTWAYARPQGQPNFMNFTEQFDRHRDGAIPNSNDSRDDDRSRSHSHPLQSPGPGGEYNRQYAQPTPFEYKREQREASSPLSDPPPGPPGSDE